MSYKWETAATPQGRERLKELIDGGNAVIASEWPLRLTALLIDNGKYCLRTGEEFPSFEDMIEKTRGLQFLDPDDYAAPAPVVDESKDIYEKTPCTCGDFFFAPNRETYFDGDEIEIECPLCGTEAEIEVSVEMRYKIALKPMEGGAE